jgi:hypothetical protein
VQVSRAAPISAIPAHSPSHGSEGCDWPGGPSVAAGLARRSRLRRVRDEEAALPNPAVDVYQGGAAARRRARRPRRPPALGGPGRRTPGLCQQRGAALGRIIGTAGKDDWAVFLGCPLSSSRPPRQWRSLRSRRMRSASPTIDPESTPTESAPMRKNGQGQDSRHDTNAHTVGVPGNQPARPR